MQCPFCGGSGKCYQQTITYEEVETNRTKKHLTKCFKCNGTGEIKQTNEEWFCSLTTEEKAKRIINIAVNSDCDYRTIVEWLKEKHGQCKN